MPLTRFDLLTFIKTKTSPLADDFRQHCHDWLLEKFPSLTEGEGGLVDGKSVDKWLDYISVETKNRWKGSANRTWKTLLGQKFYEIEIKVSPAPTTTTSQLEVAMDIDTVAAPAPIDLKDLSVFQAFNCPRCEFKCADRIMFKNHVIKSHEYIKGKLINHC